MTTPKYEYRDGVLFVDDKRISIDASLRCVEGEPEFVLVRTPMVFDQANVLIRLCDMSHGDCGCHSVFMS